MTCFKLKLPSYPDESESLIKSALLHINHDPRPDFSVKCRIDMTQLFASNFLSSAVSVLCPSLNPGQCLLGLVHKRVAPIGNRQQEPEILRSLFGLS